MRRAIDWRDVGWIAALGATVLIINGGLLLPGTRYARAFPAGDFYDQFYAFASY